MIRQQQTQIQQLQSQQQPSTSAVDDSTPTSERSMSIPNRENLPAFTNVADMPFSTGLADLPRSTWGEGREPYANNGPLGTMSRQSSFADRSRNSSHAGSPALRPTSSHGLGPHGSTDFLPPSSTNTRDESAFYQAETQNLTRENQMLKQRIRELGQQFTLPTRPSWTDIFNRTTALRSQPYKPHHALSGYRV